MSQIDEAFIQAYQTQPRSAPAQPPLAGLHHGPRIHVDSVSAPATASPDARQTITLEPEPIPAPHFRATPAQVAAHSGTATQVETPTQRRPLSTFSAPMGPPTTAFNPVFEVDAFRWPKLTTELLQQHTPLLLPVADQLLDVCDQGRSLIGIAGTRSGIGCTTVQLCLARLLASAGKSVALVDGNFAKAGLARDLGLEFDIGWEQVLTGELPLAECVVNSLNDRMALLPLSRRTTHAAELLASIQTSVTAGVLRYHYDVVLFNLGSPAHGPQQTAASSIVRHCRLDANIIVADAATDSADAEQINPLMSLFGSTCLGVIGNSTAA